MGASLKDISFEQIKGNYYYGLFEDFKLIINKKTGYCNVTKLCKDGGKYLLYWLEDKRTEDLIIYYNEKSMPGKPSMKYKFTKDEYNKIIQGIYIRKELISVIALWISVDFYYKVNKIIERYFINEINEKYINNEELKEKLRKAEINIEQLKVENQRYKEKEEDITPKTINEDKFDTFTLIKKNKKDSEYPYYCIRIQRSNLVKAIAEVEKKYPDYDVIYALRYDPNPITLFNRIKEQLKDKIETKYNDIKLLGNNYTEDKFINDIEQLSKTKF